MKGILYQLSVSNSVFELIHGESYDIKEIFIPKLGIFFNSQAVSEIQVKSMNPGRYRGAKKISEVEISKKVCDSLVQYIKSKKEIEKIQKKYEVKLTVPPKIKTCEKCNLVHGLGYGYCIKCDGELIEKEL